MCTSTVMTNEQEIWKSPWEAQEVRADGPTLLSVEKSGDPFMSFIYGEIWLSISSWSGGSQAVVGRFFAAALFRICELLQCRMYPAGRSCTPCWAIPTDVGNMLHISWITDLHLMLLLYHCKNVMSNEELVGAQERNLSFQGLLWASQILPYFGSVWNHVKIFTQADVDYIPKIWEMTLRPLNTPFILYAIGRCEQEQVVGHWSVKKAAIVNQRVVVSKPSFVSKDERYTQVLKDDLQSKKQFMVE